MSFLDIFKKKENKNIESSGKKDVLFRDTFILALVHRLRTPLNGARWSLDAVINGELNEENKKLLIEGYNKILYAINTVDEVLKVAEITSKDGDFALRKEKINLCNIVDDILSHLDFLIKKNEITLDYKNDCEPVTILADREVLDIALTNIFDNAFRYSLKGKVAVSIDREGNMVKLVIKDSGIGVDKEDLKHMFEKFYRGKNAKVVDPNESGVGLYATKEIIKMHGGSISMNSELNKGTTVEVKLPID
jgi:two-component system sensor histidine kinase VicK